MFQSQIWKQKTAVVLHLQRNKRKKRHFWACEILQFQGILDIVKEDDSKSHTKLKLKLDQRLKN